MLTTSKNQSKQVLFSILQGKNFLVLYVTVIQVSTNSKDQVIVYEK